MTAFNKTRQKVVVDRVEAADTALKRMKGLLGRNSLDRNEGLWLAPCAMIHTFFMRFSIDVLFLDREMKVVRVIENLAPWRMSPWVIDAHGVLELAAGSLKGTVHPGDLIEMN